VFTTELAHLDPATAAAIAAQVLPGAARMTTAQIRRALRKLVLDHDPAAAARRREQAARDADVHAWPEASGNAALAGRELAEADVLTASQHLTAVATWLRSRGAPGSLGQLRAGVFIALLSGRDPGELAPGSLDPGDVAVAGGLLPPPVTGTIHLTLPLATWAGLGQNSGEIAAHGPAAGPACRDLAARLAQSTQTRWALTITTPQGQPLAHASSIHGPGPPPEPQAALRWAASQSGKITWLEGGTCTHAGEEPGYRPSRRLQHLIRARQQRCSHPGCGRPAAGCDLDHTIPHHQGGRTCQCNLAPLCRWHHRAKQTPGWKLEQPAPGIMTWTLPSGRTYTTTAEPYPV